MPEVGPGSAAASAVATLRRLLIEPLALGKDVERVLVSPMGPLGYVPLSLLLPDRDVVFVPSATTYGILLRDREKRGEKVLALGDPDYGADVHGTALRVRAGNVTNLPRLPATKAEVQAIANVSALRGKATETGLAALLEGEARWRAVHFACHGLVDPEQPMLSALALTADAANDGFLTALEIFRMRLPADLVVMSACETGRGRIYKTEGILGLTRAVMFAGAPRVLCSLWKVGRRSHAGPDGPVLRAVETRRRAQGSAPPRHSGPHRPTCGPTRAGGTRTTGPPGCSGGSPTEILRPAHF